MNKSITGILNEAFDRIRDEHGVALSSVNFELVDTSSTYRQRFDVVGISIDAKLCDRKEFE